VEILMVRVKEIEEIRKLKEDRLRMIKIIKEELKRR
jgi:hypothetical protein